jgi:AcrR family transcriptional regulator
MPQTAREEQRSQDAQRITILEGAKRAFARKGQAATMADVAQAAGVSQGLAYRYFASKEQLVRALVEHALQEAALATSPLAPEGPLTPAERLTQLITRLVEYRRDHLELFQLLDQLLSADKAPNDITELIRQQRAAFLDELRQLIVAGQASGEVAAGEPEQLVLAIAATLEGLTRFGLHDPELFRQRCPEPHILLRMLKP